MLRTGNSAVRVSVIGLLFVSAVWLHAQEAATGPEGQQPGPKDFVLHTGTSLVIVDVVVHGRDGRPVHNLKASDFAVSENGVLQHIRNFAEHARPEKIAVANTAPTPPLPPGLFTNYTPAPSTGPSNVLLLDMLNTPLRDQESARMRIQEYLDHAPAGTEIAVFGLSNNLTMLQGFTANPAILKAILSRKNAIKGSSLLSDPNGNGAVENNANLSDAIGQLGNTPDVLEAIDNARQFEADSQSFELQIRAKMTLDALNELAKYLAAIPGRKNVLWFSGSFPLTVLADPSINNAFGTLANSEEEFRQCSGGKLQVCS
jgi:VWFA-related protein